MKGREGRRMATEARHPVAKVECERTGVEGRSEEGKKKNVGGEKFSAWACESTAAHAPSCHIQSQCMVDAGTRSVPFTRVYCVM